MTEISAIHKKMKNLIKNNTKGGVLRPKNPKEYFLKMREYRGQILKHEKEQRKLDKKDEKKKV